jgi:enamine deaminase RidA (YjgF/YER057c/UK114 family)
MGGQTIERFDPFDGALGFSLVVRAGSTVYTAGAFGIDPDTLEVPADHEAEVRQTFANLEGALALAGATLADVVEMTTYFAGDPEAVYPVFQQVRTELMGDNLPASTSVMVAGFVFPGMHLETKVVAVI